MIKIKKKRTLTLAGKMFFYGAILTLTVGTVYLMVKNQKDIDSIKKQINDVKTTIGSIDEQQKQFSTEIAVYDYIEEIGAETTTRSVLISNYYLGDGSSGDKTASGLTTKDFEINEKNFYTYQGLVVVATGSNRLQGLKQGFVAHNLYDKLLIEINGITYESIVLDVCGACTWGISGEELQRVDVFTVGNVIGKVKGTLYE